MQVVTEQSGDEPRKLFDEQAAATDDGDPVLAVLDRTLEVIRSANIPFLVIGEIASAVWGRDRGTNDIDLFVRPEASPKVLELLGDAGFDTRVVYEHWLSKAHADGVDVDIIYRASRDILLDEEMLERAAWVTYRGRTVPVAPAEDLVVMKAGATREDTARYWYDALGILSTATLDWDYLVRRSRQHGPRRMLSLLLFATSVDMVVPTAPIKELFSAVAGNGSDA
ncbi:MAG TPA: nucleotidyltransferase [Actinomycetota bacterium]|nr:nucleotidyltransferase [Actinomycetota bacterium]